MTARVIPLRPREFYAIVPGDDGSPVLYARTFDGMNSAIAHAQRLSAGGARQEMRLTVGRATTVILIFENGQDITGTLIPAVRPTIIPASAAEIRPGAPRGRIPETSRTAMARKAGKKPRRNPHCPRPSWPGIDI
jgi:hypothetical protein